MTKIKPFLKWAGSKFRCLDTILSTLPKANRLIEPFTGSGAIFINSNYPNYLLAEKNHDLILVFQMLQQEGLAFIDYCEQFFTRQNNCQDRYYQLREQFNQCQQTRMRAALFLYLNRHGYNGLCRYNQKGLYNVPFGRYIKPYFPRAEMLFFYEKSQSVKFIQGDFRATFRLAKPGDIIYCDPPYVPLSRSANFTSYTPHRKFNEQDQIELAQLAQYSATKGITVVISNHDTELTRIYYQDSHIISFPVSRFISCNSLNRKPAQELVAIFKAHS
ncbi:DNA adenine methylase [Legionella beliardensis]|uniref:Site-specific DNA-methyltransferase (adenine-specific) n=1 Tax=Legionella beliardensis TaxID=91822 RepID=A0A378I4X9_9GAMM|nr:Dam family site-specific DNA-(adenine-N6)-methyltransferase [Legionella beliardensis]STX29902.1 DNA adenine methylase [Legionella beliardensis]